MSGGSYDYTCYTFQNQYEGAMFDEEMNDLIKDLYEVLHDVEWWQSADISEEDYRETVRKFKDKWFKQDRNTRLKKYVDEKLEKTKKEIEEILK